MDAFVVVVQQHGVEIDGWIRALIRHRGILVPDSIFGHSVVNTLGIMWTHDGCPSDFNGWLKGRDGVLECVAVAAVYQRRVHALLAWMGEQENGLSRNGAALAVELLETAVVLRFGSDTVMGEYRGPAKVCDTAREDEEDMMMASAALSWIDPSFAVEPTKVIRGGVDDDAVKARVNAMVSKYEGARFVLPT